MTNFFFDLQRFAELTISGGGAYDIGSEYSNSTITIDTSEPITLNGNGASLTEFKAVVSSSTGNITVRDLNVTNAALGVIAFGSSAGNKFAVEGESEFNITSAGNTQSAVNIGGGLEVGGSGSLTMNIRNGSGIGTNGSEDLTGSNVEINGGTFDITVVSGSSAIGGSGSYSKLGDITINGTANVKVYTPGGYGAAIGANYWGTVGDILIGGDATVDATGGQHGAAIGGGAYTHVGDLTINGNALVDAKNVSTVDDSAAIGSGVGAHVQSLGAIVIGGNATVNAESRLGMAIDNVEWYREIQTLGAPETNDHALVNEDAITIGENAVFNGTSGDSFDTVVINGETLSAASISYSNGALEYSGGSSAIDLEDLETLMEITSGGTYNLAANATGKIIIKTADAVTISSSASNQLQNIRIEVDESIESADITIENLNVYNYAGSLIRFGAGSANKLTVKGENTFANFIRNSIEAGINIGGGLSAGGDGSLKMTVINGSCIGTDGREDLTGSNITIDSGTFDLTVQPGGAAIGGAGNGSKLGNINITGTANITAYTPNGYAAAIGAGYQGTVGDIVIDGDATVDATAGQYAAAIGGTTFAVVGDITIGDRAHVSAQTTTDIKTAAIGSGEDARVYTLGTITIKDDATVIGSSAADLAIDNILAPQRDPETGQIIRESVTNPNKIVISPDGSTAETSVVMLSNGNLERPIVLNDFSITGGEVVIGDIVSIGGNHDTSEGNMLDVSLNGGTITAADADNFINVRGANVVYNGGSGVDFARNYATNATVFANDGNDHLSNYSGAASINGGAGNDSINSNVSTEGAAATLNGDDGADFFIRGGVPAVIVADGNETINLVTENDTIQFADGSLVSGAAIGDSVVLAFDNDESLALNFYATGKVLNIVDSSGSLKSIMYGYRWTTLDGGAYKFSGGAINMFNRDAPPVKFADFTLSGGNLADTDGDQVPDDISIGAIRYIAQSGVHVNVNNLSGNVIYNGEAVGIINDDNYSAELISPIDLSESFGANVYYITEPHTTAFRGISDGATINQRLAEYVDWIAVENESNVHFNDGTYCLYTEGRFSSRAYTKFSIANGGNGMNVYSAEDQISVLSGLGDGWSLTLEGGGDVRGKSIEFQTSGSGTLVVKSTADSGKYSLSSDDDFTIDRFTLGGDNEFSIEFNSIGAIETIIGFDGTIANEGTAWSTIEGGFAFRGVADNNPYKLGRFTVSGSELVDENHDGAPDGVESEIVRYVPGTGVGHVIDGFSGEVTINGEFAGVSGDSDYGIHFYGPIDADASEDGLTLAQSHEYTDISSGATLKVNEGSWVVADDDSSINVAGDANIGYFTSTLGGSYFDMLPNLTTLVFDNDSNVGLIAQSGTLSAIEGLTDGYAATIESGAALGDRLSIKTDGGSGVLNLNGTNYTLGGDDEFALAFDSLGALETITGFDGTIRGSASWSTIEGGFVYGGAASNNPFETAEFTLNGGDLVDENNDGAPDGATVSTFSWNTIVGMMTALDGVRGEVSLNGAAVGVFGDDDYDVHFTARTIENAPDNVILYASTKELLNISNGATVNANKDDIVRADDDATIHFGDVDVIHFRTENVSSDAKTNIGVDNGGAGVDVLIDDGTIHTFDGLNDGWTMTLESGENLGDEIVFKGGSGVLNLDGKNYTIASDNILKIAPEGTVIVTTEREIASAPSEYVDVTAALAQGLITLSGDATLRNFYGESYAVTYIGSSGVLDLSDSTSDRLIVSDARRATIIGGDGDDTLINRGGRATLDGGRGDNVFVHAGGNDVIKSYNAKFDTIDLGNGSLSGFSTSHSNLLLETEDGSITVARGKNKEIAIADASGQTTTQVYPTLDAGLKYSYNLMVLKVDDDFDGDSIDLSDYGSTVKKVHAEKFTHSIEIAGNENNNFLRGGKGNDTLISGEGRDTLVGKGGSDTFVFTAEGNAIIADYRAADGDVIRIDGDITRAAASGDDFVLFVDDARLTIKDGADELITVLDAFDNVSHYGGTSAASELPASDAFDITTDFDVKEHLPQAASISVKSKH